MDVGSWLRSLGLDQYEAEFRDNEVDGAVLPKLTTDDLTDLGVAPRPPAEDDVCDRGSLTAFAATVAPRRRRAAPAHRYVLRPRRLDRASARLDPEDMHQSSAPIRTPARADGAL